MANLVVKKLGSKTGGRMFEFTKHAQELGVLAGLTDQSWEVWIQGPGQVIDAGYEVVFSATNNNQHDRLNFRSNLRLTRAEKTGRRFDKTLRKLFGIPQSLEFVKAGVLIILIPKYRRVILNINDMQWK